MSDGGLQLTKHNLHVYLLEQLKLPNRDKVKGQSISAFMVSVLVFASTQAWMLCLIFLRDTQECHRQLSCLLKPMTYLNINVIPLIEICHMKVT